MMTNDINTKISYIINNITNTSKAKTTAVLFKSNTKY